MKIGVMQPYFLPYLGYWQLMNAVDKYVIYDDVNYITRGRINRNAILVNGTSQNINLMLNKASQNKHINEIFLLDDQGISKKKTLKTLEMAYHKAPYWNDVRPLLNDIFEYPELNLALFLKHSFEVIGDYLGIKTELILSSEIDKDNSLKCENKIYAICGKLSATEYYNSVGGMDLYSKDEFARRNIKLSFPKMKEIKYQQFNNDFVPNLSIVDVMMFNSQEEVQKLLLEYELI